MNNTILIIGLALIEISVLCIGFGFYILIKAKLKAYESKNNISNVIREQYTKIISLYNDMYEQYRRIYEQYNAIRSQYQEVIKCDHKIDEDFLKLLEAWKAVEDHYSDAYEQFKEYNERLKTLEQKIDKITQPEIDFRIDPPVINGVIFDHDEPVV
jgi:predicted nuclease with TOPRIM domain